jgi:hypothetical protein
VWKKFGVFSVKLDDTSTNQQVLKSQSILKRPFGKHWRNCEDIIETDLAERKDVKICYVLK